MNYSNGHMWDEYDKAMSRITALEEDLEKAEARAEKAEARAERLQAALADIAHGPVGTWNEPQHAAEVIKHMMRVASDALKGGEE